MPLKDALPLIYLLHLLLCSYFITSASNKNTDSVSFIIDKYIHIHLYTCMLHSNSTTPDPGCGRRESAQRGRGQACGRGEGPHRSGKGYYT